MFQNSNNMTRQELISWMKNQPNGREQYECLINWVAESACFYDMSQGVRIAVADAERKVKKLKRGED